MLFSISICYCSLKESESESCSVLSDSLRPHELYSPWNSPGQNTGVGSHSLLQGMLHSSGDLPNPGIESGLPSLQVDSLPAELLGKPTVILEPKKIKSDTVSIVSQSTFHEVMGPVAMILVF